MYQLCSLPIISVLRWNFLSFIWCIANITELFLQLGWYTTWIVVFKLGLLPPSSPSRSRRSQHHCFIHKPKNKCLCRQMLCHHHIHSACCCFHAYCTVLNINDKTSARSLLNFDSNSSSFVCNNSANVHICNNKGMFIGEISCIDSCAVANIRGKANHPSGIGTVKWE